VLRLRIAIAPPMWQGCLRLSGSLAQVKRCMEYGAQCGSETDPIAPCHGGQRIGIRIDQTLTQDATYPERAEKTRDTGGHAIVGGEHYGQGSSREHAVLAPLFSGCLVLDRSWWWAV
jgi:aconitase family protein (aconitate hydratase)